MGKYMGRQNRVGGSHGAGGFDYSKYTGGQRGSGVGAGAGAGAGSFNYSKYVGGQSGEESQPEASGKSFEVLATKSGEARTAKPLLPVVLGLVLSVSVALVAYARKVQRASSFDADSRHSLLA